MNRQPASPATNNDWDYFIVCCPVCWQQWINIEVGPGCHAVDPIRVDVVPKVTNGEHVG